RSSEFGKEKKRPRTRGVRGCCSSWLSHGPRGGLLLAGGLQEDEAGAFAAGNVHPHALGEILLGQDGGGVLGGVDRLLADLGNDVTGTEAGVEGGRARADGGDQRAGLGVGDAVLLCQLVVEVL